MSCTAFVGTTIPSDSRCARLDFALGLYERDCPDKDNPDALAANQQGRANKPCAFFKTRAGCRHGDRCAYFHDPNYVASITEFQRITARDSGRR